MRGIPIKRVPERSEAARSIDSWIRPGSAKAKPKKRKSGPRDLKAAHERCREDAEQHIADRSWKDADERAVLGLYSVLHEKIYGVRPDDLDGPAYFQALAGAKRLVADMGGGAGAFEFLRWTWKREDARERRRREEGTDGARIGWRLQFSTSLVTDYKVVLARAGKRAG